MRKMAMIGITIGYLLKVAKYLLFLIAIVWCSGYVSNFLVHNPKNDVLIVRVRIGMAEAEVESELGHPYQVLVATNSVRDYWKGYSQPKRTIADKVFLYPLPPDTLLYIFFDKRHKVEEVYAAKS